MAHDPTENARRELVAKLNRNLSREELAEQYGDVYDTTEMAELFEVTGFLAPFVVVKRKSDGKVGSLQFQGSPHFYFGWQEDK